MLEDLKRRKNRLFASLLENPEFVEWFQLCGAEKYVPSAPPPAKDTPKLVQKEGKVIFRQGNPEHKAWLQTAFKDAYAQAKSSGRGAFTSYDVTRVLLEAHPEFAHGSLITVSRSCTDLMESLGVKRSGKVYSIGKGAA